MRARIAKRIGTKPHSFDCTIGNRSNIFAATKRRDDGPTRPKVNDDRLPSEARYAPTEAGNFGATVPGDFNNTCTGVNLFIDRQGYLKAVAVRIAWKGHFVCDHAHRNDHDRQPQSPFHVKGLTAGQPTFSSEILLRPRVSHQSISFASYRP